MGLVRSFNASTVLCTSKAAVQDGARDLVVNDHHATPSPQFKKRITRLQSVGDCIAAACGLSGFRNDAGLARAHRVHRQTLKLSED